MTSKIQIRSVTNILNTSLYLSTFILITLLASSASKASDHGVTQTRLANGLTVLTKEVHTAPVVCTYVWYKVGSRNEISGVTGVSHQLEHMMFKGTRKLLKPGDIDVMIGRHGGVNNAGTGSDTTSYYFLLPADQIDVALKIEADRMTQALIDPVQLKAEKTVVLSELEGGENDNASFLYDQTRAQSYLYHPYHFPVIGTKWDVKHYTRQQVYDYYRDYYAPNNATLVVVGDFDSVTLLKKIKLLWADVKPTPTKHLPLNPEPPQKGERRITVRRAGPTSYVQIMAHIPSASSPDIAPLAVLANALGNGKSSILYKSLVETQLATNVAASANQGIDPEMFEIAVSARSGVDTAQIENVLKSEIAGVQTTLLDDHTITKAKNQSRASFIFAQDSVLAQASQLGFYQTVTGDWKNEYKFLEDIDAVKPTDVMRVARKYLEVDNRTLGLFIPLDESGGTSVSAKHNSQRSHNSVGADFAPHLESGGTQGTAYARATSGGMKDSKSDSGVTEFTLPNNMRVVVKVNHANPTVTISGFVKAGSVNDPTDKPGTASFVADMLTRGTDTKSLQQIASETEFVGAGFSFQADRERTIISGLMLKENFREILGLMSQCLQFPAFPADELEKERGERLSLLQESDNSTALVATNRLYTLLYKNSNFAHRPAGTAEGIRTLTRDELLSFYHSAYQPGNTTIVIVGDIEIDKVKKVVTALFEGWKSSGTALPPYSPNNSVVYSYDDRSIIVNIPDKSQCDIAMGTVALSRQDPDYIPATIMNLILGEDEFVGRVGKRVRDTEGLAYYAYTRFEPALQKGPWMFRAGVNPKNVKRALASALDEIRKISISGVTAKELNWAKDHAVGAMKLSYSSSSGIATHLSEQAYYHLGWDYLNRYTSQVKALTVSEVNQTAMKYLRSGKLPIIIAGPAVPDITDAIIENGTPK